MTCRLCSGPSVEKFRHMVLGKYDVGYHECQTCGSLQTDDPYWLDEAYAGVGTGFDTGAAQRSIDTALTMHAILDLIGWDKARPCLDYGAGVGLYARMMRDRGYDYRALDLKVPFYMDKFSVNGLPALFTLFEVFEHLRKPAEVLGTLLAERADFMFFTTDIYTRQDCDWPYINPRQGQHVFFYSPQSLVWLAQKYGYHLTSRGGFLIFSKEPFPLISAASIHMRRTRLWEEHQRNPYKYAARDNAILLGMK